MHSLLAYDRTVGLPTSEGCACTENTDVQPEGENTKTDAKIQYSLPWNHGSDTVKLWRPEDFQLSN